MVMHDDQLNNIFSSLHVLTNEVLIQEKDKNKFVRQIKIDNMRSCIMNANYYLYSPNTC